MAMKTTFNRMVQKMTGISLLFLLVAFFSFHASAQENANLDSVQNTNSEAADDIGMDSNVSVEGVNASDLDMPDLSEETNVPMQEDRALSLDNDTTSINTLALQIGATLVFALLLVFLLVRRKRT